MDETLAAAAIDFGGRAFCVVKAKFSARDCRGLSDRACRRFLPGLRASSTCQRASPRALRALVASPGGSAIQGVRSRTAFCRVARQAAARRPAQHQGTSVIATLIDYGAGNVTSVARALRPPRCGVRTDQSAGRNRHGHLPDSARRRSLRRAAEFARRTRLAQPASHRHFAWHAVSRHLPRLASALSKQCRSARAFRFRSFARPRRSTCRKIVKLPHMGWNQLRPLRDCRLLDGISSDAYFYFAHSYAAPAGGPATAATCEHGREFTAVLETAQIFGVQFHPEKSGAPGAKLLDNFLRLAA